MGERTSAAGEPTGAVDEPTGAVDGVARAGLAAVEAAVDLDLCAYLHVADGTGPRLFLSSPSLDSLSPTGAFELLTALKQLLDEHAEGPIGIGPYDGIAVVTTGPQSRGVHAAGRRQGRLDEAEAATANRLCRAMGDACHAVEAAAAAGGAGGVAGGARAVRVVVESTVERARAEVTAADASGRERVGRAEGAAPLPAVAAAALAAVGATLRVTEVAERFVGGVATVVAVIEGEDGDPAVGASPRGGDTLLAAAAATIAAAAQAAARDAAPAAASGADGPATGSNRAHHDG